MAALFSKPKAPAVPPPPAVPTRDETQISLDAANILRRRLGRPSNILTLRRGLGGISKPGSGVGGGIGGASGGGNATNTTGGSSLGGFYTGAGPGGSFGQGANIV